MKNSFKIVLLVSTLSILSAAMTATAETKEAGADNESSGGYTNSVSTVALALGVSEQIVTEIRSLKFEATLSYILMVACDHGNCAAADLLKERATRHWGEVLQLHGKDWGTVAAQVREAVLGGKLAFEPSSVEEGERSARNDAEDLKSARSAPAHDPAARP
jgi:hypothetical protein